MVVLALPPDGVRSPVRSGRRERHVVVPSGTTPAHLPLSPSRRVGRRLPSTRQGLRPHQLRGIRRERAVPRDSPGGFGRRGGGHAPLGLRARLTGRSYDRSRPNLGVRPARPGPSPVAGSRELGVARECADDLLRRFRVDDADSVMAYRLERPRDGMRQSSAPPATLASRFAGSRILDSRKASPPKIARAVRRILDGTSAVDPRTFAAAGCDPEPDLALRFTHVSGELPTDVFLSRSCGFLQLRRGNAVVLVPAAHQRDRLVGLAHKLFPHAFEAP